MTAKSRYLHLVNNNYHVYMAVDIREKNVHRQYDRDFEYEYMYFYDGMDID